MTSSAWLAYNLSMHKQLAFIKSELTAGNTVLAYNRRVIMKPIRVNESDCKMLGDVLYIKGMPAKCWTIVRKP